MLFIGKPKGTSMMISNTLLLSIDLLLSDEKPSLHREMQARSIPSLDQYASVTMRRTTANQTISCSLKRPVRKCISVSSQTEIQAQRHKDVRVTVDFLIGN